MEFSRICFNSKMNSIANIVSRVIFSIFKHGVIGMYGSLRCSVIYPGKKLQVQFIDLNHTCLLDNNFYILGERSA